VAGCFGNHNKKKKENKSPEDLDSRLRGLNAVRREQALRYTTHELHENPQRGMKQSTYLITVFINFKDPNLTFPSKLS
jgi:hypothetical protein